MYLSLEEYKELGGVIEDEKTINKYLRMSARYIDVLTFNRLRCVKEEDLSEWEKEIIKECQFEIMDFNYLNADALSSFVGSYSINGVSINFNDINQNALTNVNGVILPCATYSKITSTRFGCLAL